MGVGCRFGSRSSNILQESGIQEEGMRFYFSISTL